MLFTRSALPRMLRHFTTFLALATATAALAQDLRPSKELVSAIDRLVAKTGIDESSPGVAIFIRVPGQAAFPKRLRPGQREGRGTHHPQHAV
ncbi:MAG: hypothetical protein WAW39_00615 [Prosthecobacter sp.]|uniref:hypothetical protein n=1 Tax=Prosthecobacter sp. TaxID=1965333 RepID=UPI003BAFD8F6